MQSVANVQQQDGAMPLRVPDDGRQLGVTNLIRIVAFHAAVHVIGVENGDCDSLCGLFRHHRD